MTHLERCDHPECDKPAEWAAYWGDPYAVIYACSEHLGGLLGIEAVYFVYPYPGDKERPACMGLGCVYTLPDLSEAPHEPE